MRKVNMLFLMLFTIVISAKTYAAGGAAAAVEMAETETNTYNTWDQLVKQYDELEKQYNEMQQQYNKLEDVYSESQNIYNKADDIQNDLNGSGDYKDLLGDTESLVNQSQWTAKDWESALKGLSGGNTSRYNELVHQYQKTYDTVNNKTIDENEYQKGTSKDNANIHTKDEAVNQTVMSSSSYEYDQLNDLATQIKSIGDQIDSADTTKKALDLQAKLSEQIALIQLEMLKMQTVGNEQSAESEARSLNGQTQASVYLSSLDEEIE